MWKKLTGFVLALVLVTLSVAAVASADTVSGSGWLHAEGAGRACMTGNADSLAISGTGVLWYFDGGEEDTPLVTGQGGHREFASGWQRWKGFDGTFSLKDADEIIVCLRGRHLNLDVAGWGAVRLTGHGSYETGHDSGRWSLFGKQIELGQ